MRRWGLCAVVGLMVAMPLEAQRVQPNRFASGAPMALDSVPAVGRQPLPPGFVTQQTFAGVAGFGIGALTGAFIGAAVVSDKGGGFAELAGVIYGLAIGGAVGSSVAVYRFSNAKGYRSSYAATLVGSVAGFFGGPLLWVTVPMGSAIGYNVARK